MIQTSFCVYKTCSNIFSMTDFNRGDRSKLGSKQTCRFTGTSVGTVTSNEDSLKCSQNSTFSLRPCMGDMGGFSTKLQFWIWLQNSPSRLYKMPQVYPCIKASLINIKFLLEQRGTPSQRFNPPVCPYSHSNIPDLLSHLTL